MFTVTIETEKLGNGVDRFFIYVNDSKGRGLYAMVNGREDCQIEYLRACEKYGVEPVLPAVDELEAAGVVESGTYVGPLSFEFAQNTLRYLQRARIDGLAVFGGLVLVRQGEGFNIVELRPGC